MSCYTAAIPFALLALVAMLGVDTNTVTAKVIFGLAEAVALSVSINGLRRKHRDG